MELNRTGNIRKTVVNPEGSVVLDRDPKIQLYLEASNLKIKEDAFYESADEKLNTFISSIKAEHDSRYIEGLAKFLADNGIKLAPVVLSTMLSANGYSFRDKHFEKIFNTPQRIAEAVALGKRFHLNNSFKKHVLKVALEGFSEFTLRKNRLEGRKVKTKDLIKLLRPKPKNEAIGKLYKAIIENSKLSRLKDTDTFVSMKSSKATDEEKIKYAEANIDKIPINQLIRNLKFIVEGTTYTKQNEILGRVIKRLKSITDYRFLNVFDLIEASIAVPQMEKALHEVTSDFVDKIKRKNDMKFDSATVLFDMSGSMEGEGVKSGFKYLVLMSMLYDNLDARFFASGLWNRYNGGLSNIVKEIRNGNIGKAFALLNVNGGTALVDSARQLISENPEIRELIVISDEVSWVEGSDLIAASNSLARALGDRKIILINPQVYKGTVFSKNVIGIASLTSSIIMDMSLFTQPKRFIEFIRNYDFVRDDTKSE